MTFTQDQDYTIPPSNIVNYMRDKVPPLGTYYIFEYKENQFVAVVSDLLGRQEVFTFSRSSNYGSIYTLSDRYVAAERIDVNVSNPLYIYSNVDGVFMEDYRTGGLSDFGIILALSLALVISFLRRFKRGKYS